MDTKTLISSVLPRPSAWRLATSDSMELTVGASKFLYGSVDMGNLYMAMGSQDSTALKFPYLGAGAGGGVGFSLFGAVGGSYSETSFLASGGEWGRVYLSPGAAEDLDIDTISGLSLVLTAGVSPAASGISLSLIFFNINRTCWASLKQGNIGLPALNFQGVAFSASGNVTTSSSAGGGGYLIHIYKHTK